MSGETEFVLDTERESRVGIEEAIFCAGKSVEQIDAILKHAEGRSAPLLLTRLDETKADALKTRHGAALDYCSRSATAVYGRPREIARSGRVALVCAGTSDLAVLAEAERTLAYHGERASVFADVGVAGLWRLMDRLEEIRAFPVVVVAAGMDAALPSVMGGLVGSVLIAVPTSVGYGVSAGGRSALESILSSCAPGILTVNIDNGFGAACAALRMLNSAAAIERAASSTSGATPEGSAAFGNQRTIGETP